MKAMKVTKVLDLIAKRENLADERRDLIKAVRSLRNNDPYVYEDVKEDSKPAVQYILSRILEIEVEMKQIENTAVII